MKLRLKIILVLSIFIELSFAQNVIVVVIDGARYSETFGAGFTYIPHMNNDLKPLGALYTNFRIADVGKTETNPGHSSILTGTWQQISNDGSQRPTKPTVFEYFRKELGSSITENFVVTGKTKLNAISYSTDLDYGFNYKASENCAILSDNQVYNNLVSIMDTYHPRLIIVNLPDTDLRGHANDWIGYLSAIINADNLVYQLWQKIQTDSYYQNNTTLFVTNDHGRHDDAHGGFKAHGDDCEGCEHIMLLAIGRNVSQGLVNNDSHYQIDLAPTIGNLLGFSTPQAVGTSLYQGTNPLPVELSSFSATTIGKDVKLSWNTATEVNNFGFEIHRQVHTSTPLSVTGWEKIGFVNGNGNSNSPKSYSYEDKNVNAGKYSYRLKQIDNDGQFEYSKTIEVDFGTPKKFELSQNYPNPFNPSTTIRFSLPEASLNPSQGGTLVKLTVYNILGQQVAVLVNDLLESGVHTINFDASNLNSGMYIYKIEAGNFVQTRKMTLVK